VGLKGTLASIFPNGGLFNANSAEGEEGEKGRYQAVTGGGGFLSSGEADTSRGGHFSPSLKEGTKTTESRQRGG